MSNPHRYPSTSAAYAHNVARIEAALDRARRSANAKRIALYARALTAAQEMLAGKLAEEAS